MDEQKLHQIIDGLLQHPNETECLEFKTAKNSFDFKKLGKYFSALCNEANMKNQEAGWMVFGVNKKHEVVGSNFRRRRSDLDKLKTEISLHTTGNITFIEIYEIEHAKGRVIMFKIPPAPKGMPVAWQGHYYGRDGESLGALNIQEIEHIRNQISNDDWSSHTIREASIDDLDKKAIQKARVEFQKKNPKLAKDVKRWDDVTFLNKAKVLIKGKVTNTAIILLGVPESAQYLTPSVSQMTWVLKDQKNVEKDYTHFGPPFILSVEKIRKKIRNLKYRHLPDGTLFPIEIDQYDSWVIREALHNCIAHQDYRLRGRINVIENPEDLVFSNLGTFIPGSVEAVIKQDAPPEMYRNPFLAQAMVNLNMIDTIGSGIKRMFNTQKSRFFPLPDYDLSNPEKVMVRIPGKVLDSNYSRILRNKPDIDLMTAFLLDKVQKNIRVSKENHKHLKLLNLVEGRYPNLFVSSDIASLSGKKAEYIKYRGFDKSHYKKMVIEFIKKYGSASRKDIDKLVYDKLSDILSVKQKKAKISNILYEMSKKDFIIKNSGSLRYPEWVLVSD